MLRILRLARRMLRVQQSDEATAAGVRERRFRALLHHARDHSPFYRGLYDGIDLDACDVADLPVVTKSQMMANYDDFVTDRRLRRTEITDWLADKANLGRLYKGQFIPFRTSGTTGKPALIVYDRKAMDHAYAATVARRAYPKPLTGRDQIGILLRVLVRRPRVALIYMTGGPYASYTAARFCPRMHSLFIKRRIFSLLDPVDRLVEKLNEFQPQVIFGYPSVLGTLAREQLEGRLNVRLDLPISRVVTCSEPLSDATRARAKAAWGLDVQDTYGTSECCVMACACNRFHRMHVMNDLCILEIVDRNGQPVPDGQLGDKVLLTNLFNHVQPIIRYEVTDVTGYATEPCDCGMPFPTLLPLGGRTNDIFYIDRAGGGYEVVHPYLFLGPMAEIDNVHEFQLVQTERNEVTLRYVPLNRSEPVEREMRRILEAGMDRASLTGRISLKFRQVDAIQRDERSGKFRQVISRVGPPPDLDDDSTHFHLGQAAQRSTRRGA